MHVYRCALQLEIPKHDRQPLLDALHDAPLALRHHLGEAAFDHAIRNGSLRVQYLRDEPWVGFESDIALLSSCLWILVRGVSVVEERDDSGKMTVTAEKIVGRRGETVRVPLLVSFRDDGVHVDPDHEDLDAVRRRWSTYPTWAQDALRLKHPTTRAW